MIPRGAGVPAYGRREGRDRLSASPIGCPYGLGGGLASLPKLSGTVSDCRFWLCSYLWRAGKSPSTGLQNRRFQVRVLAAPLSIRLLEPEIW